MRRLSFLGALLLLTLSCNGGGSPAGPSAPQRASLELFATNHGFEGFNAGMWVYRVDATIRETAGVSANINFFRAQHANGGFTEIGASAIVNATGNNRVDGGSQWGVYSLMFPVPVGTNGAEIANLTADLTCDGGGRHTLTSTF